jgi:hypothetical protein
VRKSLRDRHLTPQRLALMMKLHNALLYITGQTEVKEVLNGSRLGNVTVLGHSQKAASRRLVLSAIGGSPIILIFLKTSLDKLPKALRPLQNHLLLLYF